jgi:hypothetical protein
MAHTEAHDRASQVAAEQPSWRRDSSASHHAAPEYSSSALVSSLQARDKGSGMRTCRLSLLCVCSKIAREASCTRPLNRCMVPDVWARLEHAGQLRTYTAGKR